MEKVKDLYLKLTPDEVEDIECALRSQYANSDNLNFTGHENDELIQKIYNQRDSICRPYVVVGVHDNGRRYTPKRVIVMAEDAKWAVEYAKEKLEKTSEDVFTVKPEDVHEMTDEEFAVEEI